MWIRAPRKWVEKKCTEKYSKEKRNCSTKRQAQMQCCLSEIPQTKWKYIYREKNAPSSAHTEEGEWENVIEKLETQREIQARVKNGYYF